jgi:hypothetical protein
MQSRQLEPQRADPIAYASGMANIYGMSEGANLPGPLISSGIEPSGRFGHPS